MARRIFSLILACMMLISIVPAASAEGTHEDAEMHEHSRVGNPTIRCPACGAALYATYWTETVYHNIASACYTTTEYVKMHCNQHGVIGGNQVITSATKGHEFNSNGICKDQACGYRQ